MKWARYPPVARRSSGSGQAPGLWGIEGINYRQTINDNMLVVIMIETPTGVANAYDIASVPGVNVVIIGNNDLASFSGYPQTDDRYQAMVTKIHDGPPNDGWTPPGRGGRGVNTAPRRPVKTIPGRLLGADEAGDKVR